MKSALRIVLSVSTLACLSASGLPSALAQVQAKKPAKMQPKRVAKASSRPAPEARPIELAEPVTPPPARLETDISWDASRKITAENQGRGSVIRLLDGAEARIERGQVRKLVESPNMRTAVAVIERGRRNLSIHEYELKNASEARDEAAGAVLRKPIASHVLTTSIRKVDFVEIEKGHAGRSMAVGENGSLFAEVLSTAAGESEASGSRIALLPSYGEARFGSWPIDAFRHDGKIQLKNAADNRIELAEVVTREEFRKRALALAQHASRKGTKSDRKAKLQDLSAAMLAFLGESPKVARTLEKLSR